MSKYRAKKVTVGGDTFDSKKEYRRWQELQLLLKAGKISDLKRQVSYVLIPSQYADVQTAKGIKRRCIERECTYIADFVYYQDGKWIVEDTKGYRTRDYIIKRKLMLSVYGIRIKEI